MLYMARLSFEFFFMLKLIKRLWLSDASLIYFCSVALLIILMLSFFEYNPGFNQRTTLGRLYENTFITAGLLLILVIGLVKLHIAKVEERRTVCLVFAGMLWGLALVSNIFFDVGLSLTLLFAGGDLYRKIRHV